MKSDFATAIAGSVSAAFSTVSVYPLDTIKTHLNKGVDDSGHDLKSLDDVLNRVVFKKGVNLSSLRSVYAGLESKIFMSMTQKFLYFYIYNYFLRYLKRSRGHVSVLMNLMVGYLSAIVAVGILTPFEIAQTRKQLDASERRSVREVLRALYKEEGIKGFYKGFQTNIILCVNPAIEFSVFDQVRKVFLKANKTSSLSDGEAFWLGAFGKAVATVLTFPHVRAKVLQQANVERFRGMDSTSILITLLMTEGAKSWFAGMKIQLIKNVLASAIMMAMKERFERTILKPFSLWK